MVSLNNEFRDFEKKLEKIQKMEAVLDYTDKTKPKLYEVWKRAPFRWYTKSKARMLVEEKYGHEWDKKTERTRRKEVEYNIARAFAVDAEFEKIKAKFDIAKEKNISKPRDIRSIDREITKLDSLKTKIKDIHEAATKALQKKGDYGREGDVHDTNSNAWRYEQDTNVHHNLEAILLVLEKRSDILKLERSLIEGGQFKPLTFKASKDVLSNHLSFLSPALGHSTKLVETGYEMLTMQTTNLVKFARGEIAARVKEIEVLHKELESKYDSDKVNRLKELYGELLHKNQEYQEKLKECYVKPSDRDTREISNKIRNNNAKITEALNQFETTIAKVSISSYGNDLNKSALDTVEKEKEGIKRFVEGFDPKESDPKKIIAGLNGLIIAKARLDKIAQKFDYLNKIIFELGGIPITSLEFQMLRDAYVKKVEDFIDPTNGSNKVFQSLKTLEQMKKDGQQIIAIDSQIGKLADSHSQLDNLIAISAKKVDPAAVKQKESWRKSQIENESETNKLVADRKLLKSNLQRHALKLVTAWLEQNFRLVYNKNLELGQPINYGELKTENLKEKFIEYAQRSFDQKVLNILDQLISEAWEKTATHYQE